VTKTKNNESAAAFLARTQSSVGRTSKPIVRTADDVAEAPKRAEGATAYKGYERVFWMTESREARAAVRGRQTTSFWRAYNVAMRTLREYDRIPADEFDVPKERTALEWRLRLLQQR